MKTILNIVSLIAITFQFSVSFTIRAYANVELPQIPQRPSIEELRKSLNNQLNKSYTLNQEEAKITEGGSKSRKFFLKQNKRNIDKD